MDFSTLPSSFYRVTARAIIITPDQKLVLALDNAGELQLPGGGWEQSETLDECIKREVQEELGTGVADIGSILFAYRQLDRKGYTSLRLAIMVVPDSFDFKAGDDMVEIKLVTKNEFLNLKLNPGEGPIQEYVNQIWPNT